MNKISQKCNYFHCGGSCDSVPKQRDSTAFVLSKYSAK